MNRDIDCACACKISSERKRSEMQKHGGFSLGGSSNGMNLEEMQPPLGQLSKTGTTLCAVGHFRKLKGKPREILTGGAYLVRQATRGKSLTASPRVKPETHGGGPGRRGGRAGIDVFEQPETRQERRSSIDVMKTFEASQQNSAWIMAKPPSVSMRSRMRLPTLPLHPESLFVTTWIRIVSVACLWTAVIVPLQMAFGADSIDQGFIDVLLDIFFILDVIRTFCTGYLGAHNPPARRLPSGGGGACAPVS